MFHVDGMKMFEAFQGTSAKLRCMVRHVSEKMAVRLTEEDVDFFPMIVQNWMIDLFINVLPADASARLWHQHPLGKCARRVALKFALHLLLSGRERIMGCRPENINEVIAELPKGISPQDVDCMLQTDPTAVPVIGPTTLKLPAMKLKPPAHPAPTQTLAALEIHDVGHGRTVALYVCSSAPAPGLRLRGHLCPGPCSKGLRVSLRWSLARLAKSARTEFELAWTNLSQRVSILHKNWLVFFGTHC